MVLVHGFPDTSTVWVPAGRIGWPPNCTSSPTTSGALATQTLPPSRGRLRAANARRRPGGRAGPDQPRCAGPPGGPRLGLGAGMGGRHHEGSGESLRQLHLHFGTSAGPCRPVGARSTAACVPPTSGRPSDKPCTPGTSRTSISRWLPELMTRCCRATDLWAAALHRVEQAPTDGHWPAVDLRDGLRARRRSLPGQRPQPVCAIPWRGTPTCRCSSLSHCTTST